MKHVHLPFNLVLEFRNCKYDADTEFNYLDIALSRRFNIVFIVGDQQIVSKQTKLVQVFNFGFRYRKNRVLVRL